MNITPLKVTVREVVTGYVDDSDREEGIYGYSGRLNIRPKYQRNYIYDDAKRNAVIDTVSKDFPLGIMYWVKNDDGSYEILDGQQRTISLCTFVSIDDPARGYSIPGLFGNPHARTFSQLLPKEKDRILDYQLLVYVCEGADTDRLRWFETINIAGERLSGQEIRNAQYSGPWVTDLKRYFSRTNSPAQRLSATKPQIYVNLPAANTWNRQGGLEKALLWFIGDLRDTEKLEAFMSAHKDDADAAPLWRYFQDVIAWTKRLFPTYRKGMEKVEWGILYNQYHSHLNLRQFEDWQKQTMYERKKGRCPECVKEGVKRTYDISEMHADHVKPWHLGGKTEIENGRMLCAAHNYAKGGEW